ncbi:MAG: hypothetical protein IKW49_00635 [Opitutales bacterium]|nr:hypothetical protein [Opitutales bacterium]
MKNASKKESNIQLGRLMGEFFAELTAEHRRSAAARIDSIVDSTLVLLEQLNDKELSPGFTDYLRYVIKKSGEQKKIELHVRC